MATVDSTTTSARAPWSPAAPYMTGGQRPKLNPDGSPMLDAQGQPVMEGVPGVLPEAGRLYGNAQWSPQQQAATDQYTQDLGFQRGQNQNITNAGQGLLTQGRSNVGPITAHELTLNQSAGQTAAPTSLGTASNYTADRGGPASTYTAQTGGPVAQYQAAQSAAPAGGYGYQAAQAQGGGTLGNMQLNATQQGLLQNDVYNNPALKAQVDAAMGRQKDNFDQALGGIRSGAEATGSYGGSRQGIAEGLAAKGLAQAQGDTAANMYSNAYNLGFGAQTQTANNLMGIDTSRQSQDVNNAQQNNQFNAGATNTARSQGSGQELQNSQFNAGNNTAANMWNSGATNQMNQFGATAQNQAGAYNATNAQNQSQFGANAGNTAGQWNAGANNAMSANNAQATNQNNQYWGGLGQNNNQFNTGQANSMNLANANILNGTAQYNNNLGFQNQQQTNSNYGMGANLTGMGFNGTNNNYANTMTGYNAPNNYGWGQLQNYGNTVNQVGGSGGTGTSTTPYYTPSTASQNLGFATGLVGLGSNAVNLWNQFGG